MNARTIDQALLAVLLGTLACAGARAQAPATEQQASAYIYGAFRTDAASDTLSKDVKLGPELERHLALPQGADSRAVYEALVAIIDPEKLVVRKASAEEVQRYAARGVDLQQPVFTLESAGMTLLVQYDLRANTVTYIGQLSGPEEPIAAWKGAPPAEAPPPTPAFAPEVKPSAAATAAAAAAPASASWFPGLTPYRIEIQQGNFISQEMVSQLKSGMNKDQVRQVMGTPLLTDIFHAERWDYVFTRVAPDGRRESRKLVLFFQDGKLARVEGEAALPLPALAPSSAAGR
jgi:outer membrane protein assembly factor BamE (lipoprotein component of BamABCDE complex)